MSQVFKDSRSSPVPPAVATSYTTDVNSPAIPALNILQVLGDDTATNDTDGIRTDGSSGSNVLTVQLTNRSNITATTSDGGGQTQTVVLMTPTDATSITFRCLVTAYDSANDNAIGGEQVGLVRKSGGIVVVIGINDTFDESDVALNAADWNVITASPDLSMQFVGVAGRTIVWRALFEYTQAP